MTNDFGDFFRWCNANGIFVGRSGEGPKADFEFCLNTVINEKTYFNYLNLDYTTVIADYNFTKTILKTYFNIGGMKLKDE